MEVSFCALSEIVASTHTTQLPLAYSQYALAIAGNAPMVYVEGQERPISAREAKRRKVKVTGDAGRASVVRGRATYAQGEITKKKKISKGTAKGKADGGELL